MYVLHWLILRQAAREAPPQTDKCLMAVCGGGASMLVSGYWMLDKDIPNLIQHPASSIQHRLSKNLTHLLSFGVIKKASDTFVKFWAHKDG